MASLTGGFRNGSGVSSSADHYKKRVSNMSKENKQLKTKIDKIERENRDLKKSIYDLSVRYNTLLQQTGQKVKPFNIDTVMQHNVPSQEFMERVGGPDDEPASLLLGDKGGSSTSSSSSSRKADPRKFFFKMSLKGHKGAVYCVTFSPSGRLLASGSFDKTVRLWDLSTQKEVACLAEHELNVSDVCWSNDSTQLLSGSFDHSIKLWDAVKGELQGSYETQGLVQSVKFNPADNNLWFAGCTHKQITLFDKRQAKHALIMKNDSMVNSIYVYKHGHFVLSGDSNGMLKIWEVGQGHGYAVIAKMENGSTHKPISHLHVSPPMSSFHNNEDEEGRFLAVNSFDNVLRVYDRQGGLSDLFSPSEPQRLSQESKPFRLVCSLTAHKNKNWPIRSSFFVGKDYMAVSKRTEKGDKRERGPHESLLLSTGSADNAAYLYSLLEDGSNTLSSGNSDDASSTSPRSSSASSSSSSSSAPSSSASSSSSSSSSTSPSNSTSSTNSSSGDGGSGGELLQKIKGHKGRVYAVHFHPTEPLLATCSADTTVKLWAPKTVVRSNSLFMLNASSLAYEI
ncbi:WD domain G-beta repeat [Balamuthia mandrillaris]